MDESQVIDATLDEFRRITAEAPLVFLALPSVQGQPGSCVGYNFATINTYLYISMRALGATWNRSGSIDDVAFEVPFAIGSANSEQVCGMADWQASLLSKQDTIWAGEAWAIMRLKYPWYTKDHLDGDPVIVSLKPRRFSLLRNDAPSGKLWRTTISFDGDKWKLDEHAAKGRP